MDLEIILYRADVDPISLDHESIQSIFILQEIGEQPALEGVRHTVGDEFDYFRLEKIGSRIHRIAGYLVPGRLFEKTFYPAVIARFDQTVQSRIFHSGERHGDIRMALTMGPDKGGDIHGVEQVPVQNQNGLVGVAARVADGAAGPER